AWIPFRASTLPQALIMLRSALFGFNPKTSYSINFYLITVLVAAFAAVEPYLAAGFAALDRRIARLSFGVAGLPWANFCLFRPLVYAFGLLLFLAFDDRDAKFIYFQF